MTSDGGSPREAFAWIWLPGQTGPVVAGRIQAEGERLIFNYGRSYLDREDAVPIHLPELPLRRGVIDPEPPLPVANALRDASPDARRSQLSLCLAAAPRFRLSMEEAVAVMKRQVATMRAHWDGVCDEARLGCADRRLLWRRQFLNDLAFEEMGDRLGDVIRHLPAR